MKQAARVLSQLDEDPVWSAALDLLRSAPEPVYVVGGTVRDALLGRPNYDLDLAVDGSAIAAGRRLGNALGGAFFVLDDERDVCRVLVRHEERWRQIDLAGLRAEGIAADLCARDLTINAIALGLASSEADLLDPTGGLDDLSQHLLRLTGPTALADDPVRVLRLVRMQALLGFAVDALAREAAVTAAPWLARVTPERVRDEVLALLALDGCAAGLRYADALGLLRHVLGAAPEAARLAASLRALERLVNWQTAAPAGGDVPALGAFARELAVWWQEDIATGRSRGLLARLALLALALPAEGKSRTAWLGRLHLSRREVGYVQGILAAREAVLADAPQGDLALHRYARAYGPAGVDGAICALAAAETPQQERLGQAAVLAIGDAWLYRYEQIVAPPSLISGDELMRATGLPPGPQVGKVLAAVREAQVSGEVASAAEALAYVRRLSTPGDANTAAKGD